MHFVALALGVVTGVAGIVLIGLSLPIDLAYLGNTLVVIGTIATVGGLILIGVASVIRQLRRIAQALEARPLRSLTSEPADLSPRVASPLRTPNGASDSRFEHVPEPPMAPLAMEPEPIAPAPMPPASMAPAPVPPGAVPPAPMAIEDAAPPAAIEAAIGPSPGQSAIATVEPAVVAPAPESPVVTLAPQEPEPMPEPAPLPAAPPDLGPPPPPLPPPPEKIFEAIWSGEPIATTTRAAPREAPRELVVASATVTHVEVAEPPPPEPTGPTIFKSGVIDGMAYTLYTDGSIEAELAHGTVKFASIDELRAYLAAREA